MNCLTRIITLLLVLNFNQTLIAEEGESILELHIKDHVYTPNVLEVKAGERFKIRVFNDDPTSEEFESKAMIIEKFIGPKRSIVITLGPLKPGTYDFFGCFHPQTAKGQIIAK